MGVIGDLTTAERNGLEPLWLGPISWLDELLTVHQVDVAMVTTTGARSNANFTAYRRLDLQIWPIGRSDSMCRSCATAWC